MLLLILNLRASEVALEHVAVKRLLVFAVLAGMSYGSQLRVDFLPDQDEE